MDNISIIKQVIDGGVPLILGVLVFFQSYFIYQLLAYIKTLQKEMQIKIQELLEKQINQLPLITAALTKTKKEIEETREQIKENTEIMAKIKVYIGE